MPEPAPDASLQFLEDWWLNSAAPLWLDHGVDWRGRGFFDQLSLTDAANVADIKRVRVCARQIFVFARLARHGVPRARAAVDHGLACLLGPMRHSDGGFVRSIDLAGRARDDTRDLYDQAFVLFALAHAYRLLGDEGLVAEARRLFALIEQHFRHPIIGLVEALPATLPRRQNPHMHLLEACLAWMEAGLDGPWTALADELVGLMRERFFSEPEARLFEFFDDRLELIADPASQVFEPGHHFEWVHLIGQGRKAGVAGCDEYLPGLLARTALERGISPRTGIPLGSVDRAGVPVDPDCRIWQLCEWLRVATDRPDIAGAASRPATALIAMLDVPLRGLWRERRNALTGKVQDEPCPASSLYHIMTGTESFVFGISDQG